MTFLKDIRGFNKRVINKYILVKRQSSLDLFSAIVMETPVDKGVLRGNWFGSIAKPDTAITEVPDEVGRATVAKIKSILDRSDLLKDIYLTNNLPYAVPIEFDGISGKAERGMVRVNVARWKTIVNNNVKRLG